MEYCVGMAIYAPGIVGLCNMEPNGWDVTMAVPTHGCLRGLVIGPRRASRAALDGAGNRVGACYHPDAPRAAVMLLLELIGRPQASPIIA